MIPLESWLRVAGGVSMVASAALITRLLVERLYPRYKWLFWLFVTESVRNLVLLLVPMRRTLYASVFFVSSPILWILTCLVALELYRLLFADFPGIASAARVFLGISLSCGATISIAVFLLYARPPQHDLLLYQLVTEADQTLHLAVFLFLAMMQVFLARFPVPHRPNLVVCTIGCTLYFGAGAGLMLIMTVTARSRTGRILELILLFFSSLVLLAWAAAIRRSGEGTPALKRPWAPGEPEAVRAQLEAYGGFLVRAGRIFHRKPVRNQNISDAKPRQ